MSEEAIRQTRNQKRVLEREASIETSSTDNEHKKPKLDLLEPTPQTQTKFNISESQDSLFEQDNEHVEEKHQDIIAKTSLSLVLPLDWQSVKNEEPQISQRLKEEASSDNRTECMDSPSKRKIDGTTDTRTRRQTQPKATGEMFAAGEVEATIKVEVQAADQPVDMTTCKGIKRETRPLSPEEDDVIILSDNNSSNSPMNGLSHFNELDTELLMKSSAEERGHVIKQLKEELRLEEAKLVLLKKLKQSQIQRDTIHKASGLSGSSAPPPLIRGTVAGSKGAQQILTSRNSGTVIPPPLVRGVQQISKHSSQVTMPPLVRGAQVK